MPLIRSPRWGPRPLLAVAVACAALASAAPGGVGPHRPAARVSAPQAVVSCLGQPATLLGTDGPDVLVGTDGPDVVAAGRGNDVVRGRGGDDLLCGGAGSDELLGGPGADALAGGPGRDALFGGGGDDFLDGGAGDDGCLQGPGVGTKESCSVRVAAAGDIACDPGSAAFSGTATQCRMRQTGSLLVRRGFVGVLPLGDNQYEDGALWKYRRSYGRSWGAVKRITHPAPGNHEYHTPSARGYFDYFGASAGNRRRGYYSYDLDEWHVVVLNSACPAAGGCGWGSRQIRWLKEDLAAHPASCTLAYWHAPRFSSGLHGNDGAYDAFWRVLYRAGAEVILSGHDHLYERFAPQTPGQVRAPRRGIRQFVVGTGGRSLYPIVKVRRNSMVRNASTFGVLRLTLLPDGYEWRFIPAGGSFTDSGSGTCH